MGTAMMRDTLSFAAGPSQTTAEIVSELYATIRKAAGASTVIGCNTVSHLSAGVFEMCRIGDDTSGTDWSRTRKMGVNSLAFRGAQHNAFYVADGDCVGITKDVPWSLTREWLELVSRSGTMTIVSRAPDAMGAEQQRAVREALAIAAVAQPLGEPLDWQHAEYPSEWKLAGKRVVFDWIGGEG
jgi:alpha-galactosidase